MNTHTAYTGKRDPIYCPALQPEDKPDQPKPTTGHHPSCRESDKDLVWHCNQCGLNESAEGVTGEWTATTVAVILGKDGHYGLAAAHNAALAAKDEQHAAATQSAAEALAENHQQQLAAEKEKVQTLVDALKEMRTHRNVEHWKMIDSALTKATL